jgi:hypothetical protein
VDTRPVRQALELRRDLQDGVVRLGIRRQVRHPELWCVREHLLDSARARQQRHQARKSIHPRRFQSEGRTDRPDRLSGTQTHVDPQPQGADRRQAPRGPLCSSRRVAARLQDEGADGRFVETRDLQVDIGQIGPTLVGKDLALQVVVQRAQFDQAQGPGHQAARGGAPRGQADAVRGTVAGHLGRNQQQLRHGTRAQRPHLLVGAGAHLVRYLAPTGRGEACRQGLLHHRQQLVFRQPPRWLQAEQQARPIAVFG